MEKESLVPEFRYVQTGFVWVVDRLLRWRGNYREEERPLTREQKTLKGLKSTFWKGWNGPQISSTRMGVWQEWSLFSKGLTSHPGRPACIPSPLEAGTKLRQVWKCGVFVTGRAPLGGGQRGVRGVGPSVCLQRASLSTFELATEAGQEVPMFSGSREIMVPSSYDFSDKSEGILHHPLFLLSWNHRVFVEWTRKQSKKLPGWVLYDNNFWFLLQENLGSSTKKCREASGPASRACDGQ